MSSLQDIKEKVSTFQESVDSLDEMAKMLGTDGDNHGMRRRIQGERTTCENLKSTIGVELRNMRLAAREMADGGAEYRTLSKTWDEQHRRYASMNIVVNWLIRNI